MSRIFFQFYWINWIGFWPGSGEQKTWSIVIINNKFRDQTGLVVTHDKINATFYFLLDWGGKRRWYFPNWNNTRTIEELGRWIKFSDSNKSCRISGNQYPTADFGFNFKALSQTLHWYDGDDRCVNFKSMNKHCAANLRYRESIIAHMIALLRIFQHC